MNAEQLFQQATFYENRGYGDQADYYYRQLQTFDQSLEEEQFTRLAVHFHRRNEQEVAFRYSKAAISHGAPLERLASMYLSMCAAKESIAEEDLDWLNKQYGIERCLAERLSLSGLYEKCGNPRKSYFILLDAAERIDAAFAAHSSETAALYTDSLLRLTRYEWLGGNLTHARFHIRRLLYLKSDKLHRVDEIVKWAALLDEMPGLAARPDWALIAGLLNGDAARIGQFYRAMFENAIDASHLNSFLQPPFDDETLEAKRMTYACAADRMLGGTQWLTWIDSQTARLPNDLLTLLHYTDKLLQQEETDGLAQLWERQLIDHIDRPEAIKAYAKVLRGNAAVSTSAGSPQVEVFQVGGGERIGGTSILVRVNGSSLLLDAGMHLHQENPMPDYEWLGDYALSLRDPDALLITHAHLDHTGGVPYVHKKNPAIPIYATAATRSLMRVLLQDTVKMNRFGEMPLAAYDESDMNSALFAIREVAFFERFEVHSSNGSWKIVYYPSGHILGAGAIHIEKDGVSILFTGDYSVEDQRTVQGLQLPPELKVDVLITESTYGFLPTNASVKRSEQEAQLVESVQRTASRGGTMLIPAFAVGRAQEILAIMKSHAENSYLPFDVFLDGRVSEVCRIYERYAREGQFVHPDRYLTEPGASWLSGDGIRAVQDLVGSGASAGYGFDEFAADYIHRGATCIVASSGMLLDHSASARYAELLAEDPRHTIAFTGYLDEESPGKQLLAKWQRSGEGATIQINGHEKALRASVENYRLSAHARRDEIVRLVLGLNPQCVILMHGEHESRYKGVETIVPGEVVYPSIVEMLGHVGDVTQVIPAYNRSRYQIDLS